MYVDIIYLFIIIIVFYGLHGVPACSRFLAFSPYVPLKNLFTVEF